jgi:hypothetical protein
MLSFISLSRVRISGGGTMVEDVGAIREGLRGEGESVPTDAIFEGDGGEVRERKVGGEGSGGGCFSVRLT